MQYSILSLVITAYAAVTTVQAQSNEYQVDIRYYDGQEMQSTYIPLTTNDNEDEGYFRFGRSEFTAKNIYYADIIDGPQNVKCVFWEGESPVDTYDFPAMTRQKPFLPANGHLEDVGGVRCFAKGSGVKGAD